MSMQCSGCKEYFTGIGFFDKHRDQYTEHGRCKPPATIRLANGEERRFADVSDAMNHLREFGWSATPAKRTDGKP